MYKYNHDNDENIGLHDCRATRMELTGDVLSFFFDEGIDVREYSEQCPEGKWFSTDRAEMRVRLSDKDIQWSMGVDVFTNENTRSYRENIDPRELIEMVNGGTELEFLYCYRGYKSMLFECWLWFDHEPYSKECVLHVLTDEITYHWNEMHEEAT